MGGGTQKVLLCLEGERGGGVEAQKVALHMHRNASIASTEICIVSPGDAIIHLVVTVKSTWNLSIG